MVTGAVPGAVITAASAAATSQIALTQAVIIPNAMTAPHMIASIHGDVIRTLGPVWHYEREVLHTASNLFIEHKTRYHRASKLSFPAQEAHGLPEGHRRRLTSISSNSVRRLAMREQD
jgi:hypothetical protein